MPYVAVSLGSIIKYVICKYVPLESKNGDSKFMCMITFHFLVNFIAYGLWNKRAQFVYRFKMIFNALLHINIV